MSEIPERAATVPETARWSAEDGLWEVGERDAEGRRQGAYRMFRRDGSLRGACHYEAGLPSGVFRIYHPDGALAREGEYVAGLPHGRVLAYRGEAASPEGLRACCIPRGTWRMETLYERGELLSESFFDVDGRRLLSDGTLAPERPSPLPATAEYDEASARWLVIADDPPLRIRRSFDAAAVLVQEDAFCGDRCVRTRRFVGRELIQEQQFDAAGRLHGLQFLAQQEPARTPYLAYDVAAEHARFEGGEPVGTLELVLCNGERRRFERGRALAGEAALEHDVFADATRDAHVWSRLANELEAEGAVRLALCAAARALAQGAEDGAFQALLARSVPPLRTEIAGALGRELEGEAELSVARALSALMIGTEAASVLRALAKVLSGRPHAAHDFVQAALRLHAEDPDSLWMRAMTRLELGRVDAALADAEALAQHSQESASFLRRYARALFPDWGFWPGEQRVDASFEGLPEAPLQPLARIRRVIRVYATRLQRLRAAARTRAEPSTAAWLPPALTELLPDGPIALEQYTATIVDVSDAEGELRSEVQIDETVALDATSLIEIQARARAEWAALTWLCWAAGLDRVALPDALTPRERFAAGASQAIARAARANDALLTGGLHARAQGVAGFSWEGFDIDELPPSLARVAFSEYFELRTVFLWLCFAENHSPFQSDLRAE